jgi:hypothetical protein
VEPILEIDMPAKGTPRPGETQEEYKKRLTKERVQALREKRKEEGGGELTVIISLAAEDRLKSFAAGLDEALTQTLGRLLKHKHARAVVMHALQGGVELGRLDHQMVALPGAPRQPIPPEGGIETLSKAEKDRYDDQMNEYHRWMRNGLKDRGLAIFQRTMDGESMKALEALKGLDPDQPLTSWKVVEALLLSEQAEQMLRDGGRQVRAPVKAKASAAPGKTKANPKAGAKATSKKVTAKAPAKSAAKTTTKAKTGTRKAAAKKS